MENSALTVEQIAQALQRYYGFAKTKAYALAAAGPDQIRSPWDVPGMEPLVERIVRALDREEPLLVFGDFDTDGLTGTVLLFTLLARYSKKVHRYNPLYRENYGLHAAQVERFAHQGIRVIVTVDTGITSHEAVEKARQLGIEVLITDHHLPRKNAGPPATLYIDPPDHLLSGAHLAYLTAQAVRERRDGPVQHDPWGLALSAVGGQVDWVRVDTPETRSWVALGHQVINSSDCPRGFRVLKRLLGEHYTSSDMLSLGSMLNMAKRSHHINPNDIVEMLLPETPDQRRSEIGDLVLAERVRCRRGFGAIMAQTMEDIREEIGRPGLLVYEVQVHDETLAEVEGPLTSRIVEVTARPALVFRVVGKDTISFSGRARGGFSFESMLNEPEILPLVIDMGGHRQAIGGSFFRRNQRAFLSALRRWEQRQPPIEPTLRRKPPPQPLEQLDPRTAYLLGRAVGPFGHRLRPLRFQTTLNTKGGWAFSDDHLIELDRPLDAGEWDITFRFDEAKCDGERVGLQVRGARRINQE
jgi:single-stranded-DNA-specific exonuclease